MWDNSAVAYISRHLAHIYKGKGKEARIILTCGVLVYSLSALLSWCNQKIEKRNKRKLIKNRAINIGAIFGMDVGGTLAKLIYFEKDVSTNSSSTDSMKRSKSFVKLDDPDHREALQDLYSAMNSETTGLLRDDELSIHSPVLGGRVHFLHFETRNMAAAINLLSENSITENIHTIGCTGGGAHKYEKEFSEQLGIRVESQDELAALIKGMLFVIATVRGECFTYRPPKNGTGPVATAVASHVDAGDGEAGEEVDSWPPTASDGGNRSSPPKAHAPVRRVGGRARVYSDGIISTPILKPANASVQSTASPSATHTPPTKGDAASLRGRSRTSSFGGSAIPSTFSTGSLQGEGASPPPSSSPRPTLAAPSYSARAAYTEKVELDAGTSSSSFPYLIVNIGSGVSILKVTSPTSFERVSGSSVGGGTYWGLTRLFTGASSYTEALSMGEEGDATRVDMLVSDIYGGGCKYFGAVAVYYWYIVLYCMSIFSWSHLHYSVVLLYCSLTLLYCTDDNLNLSGSMVASSFGKLVMKDDAAEGVQPADVAQALLMMITNNIGQVAYLNAKLHSCSKIFFIGNFLRQNEVSCRKLAFAINFWSKGEMEATFFKHEGYFGALGTFLASAFGSSVDDLLETLKNKGC